MDGDKLFTDLPANKIFSEQIFSGNFKVEFCLSTGMEISWLKINNSSSTFCKTTIR